MLLNKAPLRLIFFSLLNLTFAPSTSADETLSPAIISFLQIEHTIHSVKIADTGLNSATIPKRDIDNCIKPGICLDVLSVVQYCDPDGKATPEQVVLCTCKAIRELNFVTFWEEYEACDECLRVEDPNSVTGENIDFSVYGPIVCENVDSPPTTTPRTIRTVTPTRTIVTTDEPTVVTTTEEEETTTDEPPTTEETLSPETTTDETTTTTTERTTALFTRTTTTTTSTEAETTDDSSVESEITTSTPTTTRRTPTVVDDDITNTQRPPEITGENDGGSIIYDYGAGYGFEKALWGVGIKILVVAGLNIML